MSKTLTGSMYDYADKIYEMWDYVEKEEGRELSNDERLVIACMVVDSENMKEVL